VTDEPRWLTGEEQAAWQAYRRMVRRLDARLARDLLLDSGLSWQDYDVLSSLSAADGGRQRSKDLAEYLIWSASRLSHHLTRMEKRGLVRREEGAGRGCDVILTDDGWSAVRAAAPGHVAAVREVFIDRLSRHDLRTLQRIGDAIAEALEPDAE
jgi:DNA-binding MarR family transcriptional regulator